jgi:hypothetical protein
VPVLGPCACQVLHVDGRQAHVLHRGEVLEQVVELEDHARLGHRDLLGVGALEPGQDTQDGGLARARQAHQGHDLAGGSIEVDARQNRPVAAPEPEPAHAERGAHDVATFQRSSSFRARCDSGSDMAR